MIFLADSESPHKTKNTFLIMRKFTKSKLRNCIRSRGQPTAGIGQTTRLREGRAAGLAWGPRFLLLTVTSMGPQALLPTVVGLCPCYGPLFLSRARSARRKKGTITWAQVGWKRRELERGASTCKLIDDSNIKESWTRVARQRSPASSGLLLHLTSCRGDTRPARGSKLTLLSKLERQTDIIRQPYQVLWLALMAPVCRTLPGPRQRSCHPTVHRWQALV